MRFFSVLYWRPGSLQVCMCSEYAFEPIVPLLLAFLFLSAFLFAIVLLNGTFLWAFAKEIEKLVALLFLLVEMTVFCGMLDMCRAQFWVDLFTACFGFCHCMCNSVVALFFEALLCTAWLFLRGKFLTFASFVVRWFVSVPLARFSQFPPAFLWFFLCSGLFTYVISIAAIVFVVLLKFFLIFLLGFVFAFFCGKNQCVAPICACSFCFFCVFFYGCVQLRSWHLNIKPFAILNCPKLSLLSSLSDFFVSPKLALFYCHVHVLPNIALRDHLCIFLCCFVQSPYWYCTLYPSVHIFPICTHSHTFMAAPHACDVFGEISRP